MVGVVIVAYRNPERTADFIRNQLPKLTVPYVVALVNNASTRKECEQLARMCGGTACEPDDATGKREIYVIHSAENLGFAKGNNLGVKVLERNNPCDYLLFTNDDILLPDPTDLKPMIERLDSDSYIGAIGPDVVGPNGEHQSPHRRVITAYRQIGWMLFKRLRKKRKPQEAGTSEPAPAEGFCYWVSGAFFLMRATDFKAVDGFDPDTFLYGEEVILAERLRKIGKRMYFYPEMRVGHLAGATITNTFKSDFIRKMLVDSNCIYYSKYLKTPRPIVALYRYLGCRK